MGAPVRIDFGTQSNPGRYGTETGPRHINAYVERVDEGQPNYPIYATEGFVEHAEVETGIKTRGLISTDNEIFGLIGTRFLSVTVAGDVTLHGAIAGSDDVFMARNAADTPQIAIVGEGLRYIWDGTTLSTISDSDLPPPVGVTFADQRLIYAIADGRLFWSDIDAAGSIDALSFATAEGAPDGLVNVYTHNLNVWLPGTRTTEVWKSTANADDPFQRLGGGVIPHGCAAPHSMKAVGETLLWVNDKYQVVAAVGLAVQIVSNHAVSLAIESVMDKKTIIAFVYYSGGNGFYVLSCPAWTWQFNVNTQRWLERASNGRDHWRARHSAPLNDKWYVGDTYDGKINRIDPDIFDENGDALVWTLRSAPVHAFPNRVSVDRLLLDFETGVGLNSTDTHKSNPEVGMRYSDDGGKSWSNQLLRSLGTQGAHMERVTYSGLGCTGRHGRIWELQVSAPVARALRYAAIEGDPVGT